MNEDLCTWSWLEAVSADKTDLHQYITSVEQHKKQTSDAIAQLLQIECSLRQQLSRKQRTSATPGSVQSSDPDDFLLDDVRRSLSNIVGRLRTQQHVTASLSDTPASQHDTSSKLLV